MNKKVLTLCAGFLLAGGLLSTANAIDIKDIAGNGKYYKMIRSSQYQSGGSWSTNDIMSGANAMYLIQEESGDAYMAYATSLSNDLDKRALYWKVEKRTLPGGTTEVYTFVNQLGKTLTYEDASGNKQTEFYSVNVAPASTWDTNTINFDGNLGHIYMDWVSTGASYIDWDDATNSTGAKYSLAFDFEEIDEEVIEAKDLNAELQNGFQLQIGKTVDGEYEEFTNWATDEDGNGNVFAGTLYADKVNENNENRYYLRTGSGDDANYIVLTDNLWGGTRSDLNGTDNDKGYQFKLYNPHDFAALTNKNNAVFQILKTYDFDQAHGDSLIVTMPAVDVMNENDTDPDRKVRVFVADVNNQSYLTIVRYGQANNRLTQKDAQESPYIRLGQSNIVPFSAFAGKVWNITSGNRTLSPDVREDAELDNFYSEFDPSSEILLTAPEGEWLPYYTSATNYGFVNRESGVKWNLTRRDGDGNYWVIRQVSSTQYQVWSSKYATEANPDLQYTINITEAASKVGKLADGSYHNITTAGYANSAEAVSELDGKYLTIENGVTGATMYVGKDADDNVILTEDQAEAIEFRVKDLEHDYTSHSGFAGIDTLQHYTTFYGYNEAGELRNDVQDTVRFQHFRLFEHFSEKALVYDADEHKFFLSELEAPENVHDDFNMVIANGETDNNGNLIVNDIFSTFVLKEKADGNYNIVSYYDIKYPECSSNHTVTNGIDFDSNYIKTNLYYGYGTTDAMLEQNRYYLSMKMEGNVGQAIMDNTANIYTHTNEDRIGLVDIETPEYMTITEAIDTAKISLQEFPEYYLYEQGVNGTNFLGMNNTSAEEKAALLVDTAYVRNNTYRPQYLLAVDAYHVEPVWDSNPSHTVPHLLHADSTYGRFLVNMVDSAYAYGINRNSNPYIWDNNSYYRLAFVDGVHTGDALYLNTEDGKVRVDLGNPDDKICTFAFRYVDNERTGVKIETRYNRTADNTIERGWLKYQNNVPVVTSNYNDAHVFLVDNETTEAPTANESISAEGAVSVTATDGAVVIKGAEGKNVVIATILGKVVANETVNSDNETIAVPAGIAVVSVDGESFKVVVK